MISNTDNYNERIADILGGLSVELRPVRYPSGEKYADEMYIKGLLEATQAFKDIVEQEKQEAYKKGYIDAGIEALKPKSKEQS